MVWRNSRRGVPVPQTVMLLAPVDAGLWSLDYNVANGSITLTAVPEPSTYGLGIAALALAAVAIRRRRKTPAAKA